MYGFATYTVKDRDLCEKSVVLNNLVILAGITTTGSVIADGMNYLREEEKEKREHERYMSDLKRELLKLPSK